MIRFLTRALGFKHSIDEEVSVRADLGTTERIVHYRKVGELIDEYVKEPLSTFLYDLPYITSCNIVPPRHLLNTILLKGKHGGSMSPRFTWEPFELSEQEYEEILPKLLNPDWSILAPKLWKLRLPMKVDRTFDDITDRHLWRVEVSAKYWSDPKEAEEKAARESAELLAKCTQYL
jgi:hypothetical protein